MKQMRQPPSHVPRRDPPHGFLQPEIWILLALVVLVLLVIGYLVFSPRSGPGPILPGG